MALPPNENLLKGDVVLVPMTVSYVTPEGDKVLGSIAYYDVSVPSGVIHSVVSRRFDVGEEVSFQVPPSGQVFFGTFHALVNGFAIVSEGGHGGKPIIVPVDQVYRKPRPLAVDWSKVDPDFREVGEAGEEAAPTPVPSVLPKRDVEVPMPPVTPPLVPRMPDVVREEDEPEVQF